MLCQQRPRKQRKKHNRRNIFRMILGLVLISVISICAVRLFYRSRSSPPSDSDSDYIIMAADQNGNVSDTPIENSTDADLLQTLQTLKKQEPKIQDIIDHFQEYHYPLYNSQLCHAARVLCPRFGHQLVSDERWCIPFRHYRRRINPLSIRNGKRPVIWTANHLQYASR